MKPFYKIVVTVAFIYFFSWFGLYKLGINTLPIQSEDTVPALFLPVSIIKYGSIYLDPFYTQMLLRYPQPDDKTYVKGNTPFYLIKLTDTDGSIHYLSAFTIITPILALPVYALPILANMPLTWENLIILSHLASGLLIAFSGGVFYYVLTKRLLLEPKKAVLVTCIYLFGTINFALISQALWQHGSVQLLMLLGLYFYLSPKESAGKYILSAFFWGFAFLSRPTALLPIGVFALYSLFPRQVVKKLFWYVLGALPAVLFFVWYNSVFYKDIINQGYSSQLLTSWVPNFPVSFFGVWLSPSKGILIYSPIIIFSLVGIYLIIKNKLADKRLFYILAGIVVLLHTLIISFWKHWYGGWSYGYRMSSDVLPFMVLCIVPFVTSEAFKKFKKLFIVLFIVSVLIEVMGLVFFDGIWHAAYDRGYHDTAWLWSIEDSEAFFNVRRVLVKLGLLYTACPKCLPN